MVDNYLVNIFTYFSPFNKKINSRKSRLLKKIRLGPIGGGNWLAGMIDIGLDIDHMRIQAAGTTEPAFLLLDDFHIRAAAIITDMIIQALQQVILTLVQVAAVSAFQQKSLRH